MAAYVYRPQEGEEHLLDSQWIYLLKAFNVEEIKREDIGDLPVVVIQPETGRNVAGEISLQEFTHPENAVYMFGASHGIMQENDLSGLNIAYRVFIPLNNDWELFGPQAAGIVLWDRVVSLG